MADKYTIQVDPQVSRSDGKKMEKDLNRRFARVSKKFGKHLGRSLKSAAKVGFAAAAAGVAAVVLTNPFEKINSDLNQLLEKFDNTSTRAGQFGVSAGKYFEAEQTLGSTGVKNFDQIIARFATTLEKARPRDDGTTEDPYLREFLGAKDDLDAFYAFAKRLKTLNPTERNNAAETVFGEKMGGKIAEALQTDLAARRKKLFGSSSREDLTKRIDYLGRREGEQSNFRAKLAIDELIDKSNSVTSETLKQQNRIEKLDQEREAIRLSQYEVFASMSEEQKKMSKTLDAISESVTTILAPRVEKFQQDFGVVKDWIKSKFTRNDSKNIFK
tara:strand:- start:2126 stop:3112 length:987 start_codon:yes stop_codon:yes gene_type:complete